MAVSLTDTVIAEKYRLGERLRHGDTADLYDARHVLMDKQVSIRVLRPSVAADSENVEKFFDDAKVASQINDPHVLNITDFGSDRDGFVYSVHEPFAGKTLKDVLSEEGAFPVHSTVEIARQVAQGLSASHSVGRVHGNLSTENVVLTGTDGIAAKVLDFGSANAIEREAEQPPEFAYLSPEQCAGSANPTSQGDIYSLGAITFEMLAGTPPFTGDKPSEVMLKQMEEMPAPLSSFRTDIPDGLEAVILKALSKNPEMRQQTAQEFANEISPIGETAAAAAAAASAQNNLWKTAFIVLVGMTLLGAFLIYGTYTKRTEPTTALQSDVNGQPVQPINPATGVEEQSLAAMPAYDANSLANSNISMPGTMPGGDGYNPWANGGAPPPGGPAYIPPGGQVVTIDPTTGSPFMPNESGVILVPVPANSNSAKPTPTPKQPAANANTGAAPQTSPAANSAPPKTTPTPVTRPTKTPRPAPAKSPTTEDEKQID
jgi:serine/threonine protein kinase